MADKKRPAILNRIAQVIGAVSFLMLLATGILAFLYRQTLVEQLFQRESGDVFGYILAIFAINAAVSIVLALLIISRYPDHAIGWLLLTIGFLFSWFEIANLSSGLFGLVGIPGFIRPLVILGGLAYLLPLMITMGLVPLFFPDGRLPSRRWRPVLAIVVVGIIGQTVAQVLTDMPTEFREPFNAGAEALIHRLQGISEIVLILGIVGSLASLVARYIRSRGDERTQMNWLVYTAVMSISTTVLMSYLLGQDSAILGIYASGIPTYLTVAIGLAILRYRLYGIDIVIRRTLQYAVLTFILGSVYYSGVVLLQNIFGSLAGRPDSPLITVISTLTIAGLFNPVRVRIQDFIDQRFFRKKYDADRALRGFAAAVRNETDLDTLTDQIVDVVSNTMRPKQVGLWFLHERPRVEEG